MSTVNKLDSDVRLDRYLRKEQRRDLQKHCNDLALKIREAKQHYQNLVNGKLPNEAKSFWDSQCVRLVMAKAAADMAFKEITKICKTSRMTGKSKDALLERIGAIDGNV